MSLIRHLLFFFISLISCFAVGQRIEFFKEELAFTIDSASFSVDGDYCFRNPSNDTLNVKIFYPVSKNPGHKAIDTILVYDVSQPDHPLRLDIRDSVASFSLSFLPLSEKCIKVHYRQLHNGSTARYILLTTQKWQKPIELAKYSLMTGQNMVISHFSIVPDRTEDFGQTRMYYWSRQFFMPDTDFVFDFIME